MQRPLLGGLRPGRATGLPHQHAKTLAYRRGLVVKAAIEAPSKAAKLSERHLQLLQQHKGPLVKIATHYHVGFGDCLKVIGSSEELGAWKADDAPLMRWNEGDVWTLVTPLPPGEHEFKVVVQQASGNLVWEAGDHNRMVTVPEDAPVGSMVCSVCAFNIIDDSAESKVQPVTADVLALLDAQMEEEAAEEKEKLAAAAEAAAVQAEQARVGQAAAAVAKALATMDAEAEESGIRPRTMSDSDTEDAAPEPTTPPRSRAGPAVVAATATEAAAPAAQQQEEQEEGEDVATATAADAQRLEAALVSSGGASEEQEQEEVVAHAEEEMEANLESMSQEVHPDEQLLAPSTRAQSAAAVHAKFSQGKAVAVGFVDKPVPAAPTNSVVAAFMKSVGGKGLGAAAPAQTEPAAAAATAAVATPEPVAAAATAAVAVAKPAAPKPAAATYTADSGAAAEPVKQPAPVKAAPAPAVEAPAAPVASPVPAAAPGPLPKGWGPGASAALSSARPSGISSVSTSISTRAAPSQGSAGVYVSSAGSARGFSSSAFSSSMVTASAGTPPNSPKKHREKSPGRGSSHVVSAAAAAAVAADWIANVRNSNVVSASREAEKAASELAARLQEVQHKKEEAAAEAQRLEESMVKGVAAAGSGNGGGSVAAAVAAPSKLGYMGAARSKVREMTGAASSDTASTNSTPLSPPPITPVGGSASFAVSAPTAGGPTPPPVVSAPAATQGRNVSTQAMTVNGGSSGGAGALTASGAFSAASAEAEALEGTQEGTAGGAGWSEGMQTLAAVVGCAAVGTVLWSEFVLKDTGCGLPPGPYGLMGAAEGLSYLTVLGFAGAGVGARVNSGGKQGLQGALAIPETLAYGALAAGLMVLASQLYEYGYIPPPLPGGQCFADSAVAMPGADDLNNQLGAQVAALQAVLSQLQSAAVDGINKLQLQEQLAVLQAQVDAFSGYVSAQGAVLDAQVSLSLFELQDSLYNATSAVSTFVDTQLQQLDVGGKLSYVLDILRNQEHQLKVELPRQLAELQQLAATSMAVVQETALHASGSAHLPELLSSLDQVMAMLHGVLETRISQLDVVLTSLQGSIGAAAGQLAAAVAAAEQSGSQEAVGQLQGLQVLLSDAMSDVQAQVWAGYQQLALADKLSDMLLTVRTSAAAVAGSTAAEVDKLRLQEQLQQLEGLAEASAAALAANAMDGLHQLQLEERLSDIATQASAAAASLKAGLQQQYAQQLPAVQSQMASLQASLAGLAAKTEQQVNGGGPELETLLRQLQQSMEGTMRLVGEVASSGVTAAGDAVQNAGGAATSGLTAVSAQLGAATDAVSDAVSATLASSIQEPKTISIAVDAAAPLAAAVQEPAVIRSAAVNMAAPLITAVQDSAPAIDAAVIGNAAPAAAAVVAAPTAGGVFSVDESAVAAAYAEAVEAGLDFSTLVAYALQDHKEVLESLPNPDIYNVGGGNLAGKLMGANDTIKSIWFNRPQ